MIKCPVATQELRPVPRPRGLASPKVGKGHATTKLAVPVIAREQRASCRVDLSHDEGSGDAS